MPNNIQPTGDDLRWKTEVDRIIEQKIMPELKRLEELIKASH